MPSATSTSLSSTSSRLPSRPRSPASNSKNSTSLPAPKSRPGWSSSGILRGRPDDLVERDAHALFFPHGLGHMLGLATHDAGGCLAGRAPERPLRSEVAARRPSACSPATSSRSSRGSTSSRRSSTTRSRRSDFADCVDWAKVDALREFGGIRIEDDVLVTQERQRGVDRRHPEDHPGDRSAPGGGVRFVTQTVRDVDPGSGRHLSAAGDGGARPARVHAGWDGRDLPVQRGRQPRAEPLAVRPRDRRAAAYWPGRLRPPPTKPRFRAKKNCAGSAPACANSA